MKKIVGGKCPLTTYLFFCFFPDFAFPFFLDFAAIMSHLFLPENIFPATIRNEIASLLNVFSERARPRLKFSEIFRKRGRK